MFTKDEYLKYAQRVVAWNRVPNGGKDSTNIKGQLSYTLSEVEELEDAIREFDCTEILDAVCDIFVTASYYRYQLDGFEFNGPREPSNTTKFIFPDYFKILLENELIVHDDILSLINWACQEFGKGRVVEYMEKVLASNDSKYVPDEEWSEEYEVKVATEKYAERDFKNIVGVPGELNGMRVWILRADNGQGKILKPTTFKEPLQIKL